ncbi:RHS repeat-associated core domain-containing protein, partial [Rubritalea squalenifaciens DSM 18772]
GLEFKRERSGATTTYSKDILKRTYRVTSKRSSTGASVYTTTAYDGLTTTVNRNDGTTTLLVSESTKTLSGLSTTYKYPDADGDSQHETGSRITVHNTGSGSTTTNTAPDGSTTVTVTYMDGSTKSSTDQASNTTSYDKGTHALSGGGLYSLVTAPNTTQSTKTYRDQLGRPFRTEYADGNHSEMSYYAQTAAAGARGKLHITKDADEVTLADSGTHTSYGYNAEGERNSVTTQLPDDQTLVQTTDSDVVSDGMLGVCFRTRSYTNGVLVSTSLRSSDGYSSKTTTLAGTSSSSRTVPLITYYEQGDTIPQGKQIGDIKTIDGTDGKWEVTSVAADGTQQKQFYSDGLMKSAVSFESGATLPSTALADITNVTDTGFITGASVIYDAFGRTTSRTDARTGTVTYNSYRENGGLVSMTDAGSRTTSYEYDKMGRTIQVNAPDTVDSSSNTLANITYTSYYPTGQVKATWGDQTYARFNVYDSLNRLTELRTYQNLAHGTEPTSATTGFAKTAWIYDGQRGWLLEKNYDGETDDGSTDPDYTYTSAGRLLTRTWERGITTTYSYENGMLASTAYSDGTTPGVVYTYDSYGRVATVTQGAGAAQNVHTYSYDASTLQLDSETISYANATHVRTIDRHYDSLLRPEGYELKTGSTVETAVSYGYDNAGRLHQVGTSYPLPTSPEFTYGYLAESGGMVETVTGPAHSVTNTYASDRNVLAQKKNEDLATTPATVSHFTYSVNALGQRESQTTAGTAFSSSFVRSFGYDAKGQVVSDNHDTNNAFDRTYAFDGIGNRTSATENTTTVNYTANSKNQYSTVGGTSRTHDTDGNLTNDGKTYIYDAENRLIEVKDTGGNTVEQYEYDYLSRRITRSVYGGATVQSFIYDGWNPIAMYNAGALSQTYTWGKDLSGSMQGAGGVGGLLEVSFNSNSYYPTYDGNGNVSEYLDSSGSVVAHFEYDAFGKTVVENGTLAGNFFHRFSTKQWNPLAELYYYGYRFYAPETGRWINRDPISDLGSVAYRASMPELVQRKFEMLATEIALKFRGAFKYDELIQKAYDAMSLEERNLLNMYLTVFNNTTNLFDADGRAAPVIVVGGVAITLGIAETVAASFGVSVFCCLLMPDCRAAMIAAMSEAARCLAVSNQCIADCSDTALPTKGGDGWDFYKCVRRCMEAHGC